MKVADLQDILDQVGRMLASAGSRGPSNELAAFRDCLEPFREMTAKQLATELRKLTDPKPAKAPRSPKAPKVDIDFVVREVQDLYARAAQPSTTMDEIDTMASRLEPLTKAALVKVAEGIELLGMQNKSKKGDIVAAIKQRIVARKGASQRANLIDRAPVASSP